MLNTEQKLVLGQRLLDDDLAADALAALCQEESAAAVSRLIDEGQARAPSPTEIAVHAAEARFWRDLVSVLRRRVKEQGPREEGGGL